MAQFASDAFTGTSGTELSSYSANWVKHSFTGSFQLSISDANRVRPNTGSANSEVDYYHTGTPASADYSVSADVYTVSSFANSDLEGASVLARMNTSTADWYLAQFYTTSSTAGNVQLYKVVSGSYTQLGSNSSQTVANGNNYQLKLKCVGTAIDVYWAGGGSPVISQTDSAHSSAGKSGIRLYSEASNSQGLHIDNFSGDDVSGGTTVDLTGIGATGSEGTLALSRDLSLSGQSATGSEGTLSPSRDIAISGQGATGAEGALALSRDLGISGFAISGFEGALNPVVFTAVMAEPVSDTTPGAWLPSTPAAPLYSMIDETVVDDADYDYTGSLSTMRLALGTMSDPSVNYGHRFIYRIKGDGSTSMIVRIGAGATTVATYTHSPAPASLTTYEQMFTSAQVDTFRANSGYTGGWIEFEAA